MQKKRIKGFTLVELIVVLVILAILAAIMVPSMIGFIDKAKEKSLVVKARHLITAIQTDVVETYGIDNFQFSGEGYGKLNQGTNMPSIRRIVELSGLDGFGDPGEDYAYPYNDTTMQKYAIKNGFGFGQANPPKEASYYHFKALVNANGEVEEMSFCDGESIAVYTKKDGFTVKKKTSDNCKGTHEAHELFNHLYMPHLAPASVNAVERYRNESPK